MKTRFTPTGNDDAGDDRDEGHVREPSLPLPGHEVSEDGSEERGSGANGLVKGDGEVAEGDVAADDGAAEDETEGGDLEELDAGSDRLHRDHLEPRDGDVAEERARGHVTHGEEDRVPEAIVTEQVLVEQQNPNIGAVPGRDEPDGEETARALHF